MQGPYIADTPMASSGAVDGAGCSTAPDDPIPIGSIRTAPKQRPASGQLQQDGQAPRPRQRQQQQPPSPATAPTASPFAGASKSGFEPSGPPLPAPSPFAHAPHPLPTATSSAAAALLLSPSLITAPSASHLVRMPTIQAPKARPQPAPRDAAAAIAAAAIRAAAAAAPPPDTLARVQSTQVHANQKADQAGPNGAASGSGDKARRAPLFVGAGVPQQGQTSRSEGGASARETRKRSPWRYSRNIDQQPSGGAPDLQQRQQRTFDLQTTTSAAGQKAADLVAAAPHAPSRATIAAGHPHSQSDRAAPAVTSTHPSANFGPSPAAAPRKRAPLFVGDAFGLGAWGGEDGNEHPTGMSYDTMRASPSLPPDAPLPPMPFPFPIPTSAAAAGGAASQQSNGACTGKKPLQDMYLGCSWASACLDDMQLCQRSPSPRMQLETVRSDEHPSDAAASTEEVVSPAAMTADQTALNRSTTAAAKREQTWHVLPPTARTQTRLATSEHSRQLKDSARMSTQQGRPAVAGRGYGSRDSSDVPGRESLHGSSGSSSHGAGMRDMRSTGSSNDSWRAGTAAQSPRLSDDQASHRTAAGDRWQGGGRSRESSGGGSSSSVHAEVWVRLGGPGVGNQREDANAKGGQGRSGSRDTAPAWTANKAGFGSGAGVSQNQNGPTDARDMGRWEHGRQTGGGYSGKRAAEGFELRQEQGEAAARGAYGSSAAGSSAGRSAPRWGPPSHGPAVQAVQAVHAPRKPAAVQAGQEWREMLGVIEREVGGMDAPSVAGALHRLGAARGSGGAGAHVEPC